MNANNKQVGGNHYKGGKYQHWDFVIDTGTQYLEAMVSKYICRHPDKNKDQDVEKAGHFIEKLLEVRKQGYRQTNFAASVEKVKRFCDAYALGDRERSIVRLVTFWQEEAQLEEALRLVNDIRATDYHHVSD